TPMGGMMVVNGGDNRLMAASIVKALGCDPWTVPDLADTSGAMMVATWATNELMAAYDQAPPQALVPALDPFVLNPAQTGQPDLAKVNAYRMGANQPQVTSLKQADTTAYCKNLLTLGLPRLQKDQNV